MGTKYLVDTDGKVTLTNDLTIDTNVLKVDTAANNVGIGTASPAASSLLDLTSTTAGLLVPRMTTTQRDAISTPAASLLIYNTTTSSYNTYIGSAWIDLGVYKKGAGTNSIIPTPSLTNTAAGTEATVSGGDNNSAAGPACTVAGGDHNTASNTASFVGGGQTNTASGELSIVGGGSSNTAAGGKSTVGGGLSNSTDGSGTYTTICGGRGNSALDAYGFIGGGWGNSTSPVGTNKPSTVAGGISNDAQGGNAFIGGGEGNQAKGTGTTVAGGVSNTTSSVGAPSYMTISGGNANSITKSYGTISGGLTNSITGEYAVIPGGTLNTASADYTLAAGRRAKAATAGTFVWADSTNADFTSTVIDSFVIRAAGGVGINTASPSTALTVSGTTTTTALTVTGLTSGSIPFTGASGAISQDNSKLYWNDADDRLGIGTNSPSTALDLNGALTQRSMAAPSVSPAGQARLYFDSGTNKLRISENTAAYTDVVFSASSALTWTKYTVAHGDFTAAATSESLTLFTLPAGGIIHGVKIKHSTAFSGGGATSMTVAVGIIGNTTKYASSFDVFQAAGDTTFQLSNTLGSEDHGAGVAIKVTGTSDVNVVDLTAGSVDIWILASAAV